MDVRQNMWLQQDGAPPHYSQIVRRYLDINFPNRWIGRGGPIRWPPRSPDLTKLDFLWGFIKAHVYREPPTTKADMMERIRYAFQLVHQAMLHNVGQSFKNEYKFVQKNEVVISNI